MTKGQKAAKKDNEAWVSTPEGPTTEKGEFVALRVMSLFRKNQLICAFLHNGLRYDQRLVGILLMTKQCKIPTKDVLGEHKSIAR